MGGVIVIGDEVSCSGFRLAGVRTYTPAPDDMLRVFREALAEADVLVLTAAYARMLPEPHLEEALSGEMPAVAIIPDVRGQHAPLSLAKKIREILGIEG